MTISRVDLQNSLNGTEFDFSRLTHTDGKIHIIVESDSSPFTRSHSFTSDQLKDTSSITEAVFTHLNNATNEATNVQKFSWFILFKIEGNKRYAFEFKEGFINQGRIHTSGGLFDPKQMVAELEFRKPEISEGFGELVSAPRKTIE